jgi:hypothetical protein
VDQDFGEDGKEVQCFPSYDADNEFLIQTIIRGRPDPASPITTLGAMLNDRRESCKSILNTPLRPRHDTSIADLDPKYFVIHKYIGDMVWMSGGAEPVSDDEEDEDWDDKVLSDTNIGAFTEKLQSPENLPD